MIVTALGIVEISLLYDFSHTLFFLFSVVQFSRTKLAVFCRQLFYYITKLSVCQVLFQKFFDFFQSFFPVSFPKSPSTRSHGLFMTSLALPRTQVFPSALHRSACLIYHFFPLLSTTFYYLFCLHYTPPGVSSIY